MKKLFFSSICLIFLFSCTSATVNTAKQKEIAVATQRLGEEYYNAGKYTAALKNLLEAEKTIPDDPYLNNSLGLVYLAKDRYKLAEIHFKKALSVRPNYVQATNNLGAVYLKMERWDDAIECFLEVSENLLYATPEVPLANLGWAYYHQGYYRKARTYFDKSLDIQPNYLVSIHGLALTYLKTGNPFQALDYVKRHLEKNPGVPILHADLARTYEALGRFDLAKKSWQVVLKLSPETSQLYREAQDKLY